MSLLDRIDLPEPPQAEPGRKLVRVGDDRGHSLAERLSWGLHRLAWRTPFHRLRLRGSPPLKLMAVPKDPIAGDRAAGEALLDGNLVYGRHSIPLDRLGFVDPDLPQGLVEHLHSFAWLRDLAAAAGRERGAKLAERLVAVWLGAHADHVSEPAWRADLWGRRILFWAAYAPYILSSRDLVYRSAVLNTVARGARHLERGADKVPAGLGRITAWSGVIAAALLVQGGPARLGAGEKGLDRALAEAIHEDGGLVSRSPVEQLALVELLAQLRAMYIAARRDVPEMVLDALSGAAAALLAVTLGDGALSSWQSGNMACRRRVEAALEGAGLEVAPLRHARGWGYHRMEAKKTILVFDAAPPPASRVLTGGCASTLAFELSDGTDRLVVNCGGAGAMQGALPPALARGLRTTAAHSTLILGESNSTAVYDDGSLGKGVTQVEVARDETGGTLLVEAVHDGYVRRFGFLHQRQLKLSPYGIELFGEDLLVPRGRRRGSGATVFAVRFHLGPAVEVTGTADGKGALLRVREGSVWQFRCRGGAFAVEESVWVDGLGRPQRTQQLAITGEAPAAGITISWLLRRAG